MVREHQTGSRGLFCLFTAYPPWSFFAPFYLMRTVLPWNPRLFLVAKTLELYEPSRKERLPMEPSDQQGKWVTITPQSTHPESLGEK